MDEEEENFVDCDECDFQIDLDEGDYCSGHEEKCPNYRLEEQMSDCECSIFYHAECCPICQGKTKVIREHEQHGH